MLYRAVCVLLIVSTGLLAADPPGADEWKYDVIHFKRGQELRGLVLEQTATTIKVRCISRKPGKVTLLITENVPRTEVARLELLNDDDRKQLQNRLDLLKREREVLAAHLQSLDPKSKSTGKNGDAFDLRPADWPPDSKVKALSYQSAHFRLIANARPELVQLAAIHLEQAYAAYARTLPPRSTTAATTTILLTRSLAEYQAIAKSRGLNLINPAFYDPARNQVVCGSNLERLCDELQEVREHHERLRGKMNESKAELKKVYRGKVPAELLAPMAAAEKRIVDREKANDKVFAAVRDRLFTRLYHEAFHAYLGTFVYPAREGTLPHWFNEGLAQIFETAIMEVGELRIGHADPTRLAAVRDALKENKLLPLTEVLRAAPNQFHLTFEKRPMGTKPAAPDADRCYLASWALAFYLTFDRHLLGTKALDDYVHSLKRGTDELLAFRDLVGKPLPEFEKEYLEYLRKLRLDGTTGK